MIIAQISDTHIVERGEETLGFVPMAENLECCINHINQMHPPPDIVLHSGDVTDTGTLDETSHAKELLDHVNYPYFVVPGNHDKRPSMRHVFYPDNCPSDDPNFLHFCIEQFPLRLIGLDSTIPDAPGGELCEVRLNWLNNKLAESPGKPTLIFMHHPPIKCGVLETDRDGFIGSDKFGEIIGSYTNIERIICGHIHLATHARWNNTIVSTSPSMGMRLGLDLTQQKQSAFYLDNPAHLLHHWTPQNQLITHTINVQDWDGPHPFEYRTPST